MSDKNTARAIRRIQRKVATIPATLEKLRGAAELLAAYGWFDESNIERYSQYDQLDMVRDAIGETAEMWSVPATARALIAYEERNAWFVSGREHNATNLLERWKARNSSAD